MKKIYLLMSAVLVALSSFAAPKVLNQSEPLQLNENAKFEMLQVKYENEKAIRSGKVEPMRTWQDNNGTVWNAYMLNNGGLWSMVGDGTLTAEDFPGYWVTLNVYNEDQSFYYTLDLAYPSCLGWFYDSSSESYDKDECASVVGAENINNPSPLEWYDNQSVFTMIDEGYVSTFGILHPGTVGTTCTYNGTEGYAFDDNTTLYFANYDSELSYLEFGLNGSVSLNQTRSVKMDYAGDITILGLVARNNTFNVGEVHVFDCGDIDYDNEDWGMVYLEEFEPVRRYWVAFSSTDFAYYNPETGGAFNDVYTSTQLPNSPGAYTSSETATFRTFYGAFFAPEGSEKPYGNWALSNDWIVENGDVMTTPEAYELIQGAYNLDISNQDGTHYVEGNFYRNPQVGMAEYVIGDVNEGMRFVWVDRFGDFWDLSYKGEIFFHNDPTDYLKFEMIPSVGTEALYEGRIDSPVSIEKITMPETEKINVKVVGNSIVAPEGAEIYNLNGVRVNANDLENGLYIVKVGKNAVKVVL